MPRAAARGLPPDRSLAAGDYAPSDRVLALASGNREALAVAKRHRPCSQSGRRWAARLTLASLDHGLAGASQRSGMTSCLFPACSRRPKGSDLRQLCGLRKADLQDCSEEPTGRLEPPNPTLREKPAPNFASGVGRTLTVSTRVQIERPRWARCSSCAHPSAWRSELRRLARAAAGFAATAGGVATCVGSSELAKVPPRRAGGWARSRQPTPRWSYSRSLIGRDRRLVRRESPPRSGRCRPFLAGILALSAPRGLLVHTREVAGSKPAAPTGNARLRSDPLRGASANWCQNPALREGRQPGPVVL
jgi:hypothetical protein